MTIMILKQWYTKELVDSFGTYLFVFGDNCQRQGMAGQAQIRGAKNAIGLATKRTPSGDASAYFSDDLYDACCTIIDNDIAAIKKAADFHKYSTIVFPKDGLGTGLSQLPERAPKVFEYLSKRLEEEFNIGTSGKEDNYRFYAK